MRIENIEAVIAKGKSSVDEIKYMLSIYYKKQAKNTWLATKNSEYDVLFTITETYTESVDGVETTLTRKVIDPIAIPFHDWLTETKSVLVGTETLMDDNGVAYESEIFEEQLIRPYIEPLQADIDALVDVDDTFVAYKLKLSQEAINTSIEKLTVTTTAGNTFDATLTARQNMADGILASETLAITQTIWRLADNSEAIIDITELREAHALALQAYATTKSIGA